MARGKKIVAASAAVAGERRSVSIGKASLAPSPSDSNSTSTRFLLFAVTAGTCAAMSGVCTKFGVSTAGKVVVGFILQIVGLIFAVGDGGKLDQAVEAVVRLSLILANGIFTAQMWRYLIKAFSLGPTGVAHGLVTATNLAVSALAGVFLLGEEVPGKIWLCGGVLVACGLYLLIDDGNQKTSPKTKQKTKE